MDALDVQALNVQALNVQALNGQVASLAPRRDDAGCPNCPRCGAVVHLAERSAFSLDGRIRHSWCCDRCGEEFVTSISVLPLV